MLAILNNIIRFSLTIDIIAIPAGIIAGIVFSIKAHSEQDAEIKKSTKRWMWWLFFGPVGLLILLIVINGFLHLLVNTFRQ